MVCQQKPRQMTIISTILDRLSSPPEGGGSVYKVSPSPAWIRSPLDLIIARGNLRHEQAITRLPGGARYRRPLLRQ